MDLRFTPEEIAFRDEVRALHASTLPAAIRNKMVEGRRLGKDDIVTWQRILNAKGWAVPHWPKEWGGTGWSPVQRYICSATRCSRRRRRSRCRSASTWSGRCIDRLRQRGAEEALPAAHRQSRRLVVPGILRAGRRLRPRLAEDRGQARRRPLRRQRPEDLDDARAICRLDLLSGAHRCGGEEAGRHFVPADRHAHARHHRAPDPDHRRRPRSQRGVLRRREGAGREPGRRGEQGLGLRQVPARQRAHRHRPRRHLQGAHPPPQGTCRARAAPAASRSSPTSGSAPRSPPSRSS